MPSLMCAPGLLCSIYCLPATTQELLAQQHVGLGSHNVIDPSLSSQPVHLVGQQPQKTKQMKLHLEED